MYDNHESDVPVTVCAMLARTVAAKDTSNNYQWLSQDLEVPFLVYFDNFANNTEAPVYHSYIRGMQPSML